MKNWLRYDKLKILYSKKSTKRIYVRNFLHALLFTD